MSLRVRLVSICAGIALTLPGCFYPPTSTPPPAAKTATVLNVPYDQTWDAIHTVVKSDGYQIYGEDPDHGIIEAQTHSFTVSDADCGQARSLGSRYPIDAAPGSSAVYNFKVEPAGPRATRLSVAATFSTPLHVPFRPVNGFECISHGVEEQRLLEAVENAALSAGRARVTASHPPAIPTGNNGYRSSRPTLLGPDILKPRKEQAPNAAN